MSENLEKGFWRWGNPILWGVVLTVAVFAVMLLLAAVSSCAPTWWAGEACQTKWNAFLAAPPNEIGDTLAGFAGTLAFIWIIVTVWLQSIELSEQRKELEEQRIATQDMARSMAAQAKVFEDEQRQRAELRAKEELEELLNSIVVIITEHRWVKWTYKRKRPDNKFIQGPIELFPHRVFDGTVDDKMAQFTEGLISACSDLKSDLERGTLIEGSSLPKSALREAGLLERLDELIEIRERLSVAQQIRFDRLEVSSFRNCLNEIYSLPVWDRSRADRLG